MSNLLYSRNALFNSTLVYIYIKILKKYSNNFLFDRLGHKESTGKCILFLPPAHPVFSSSQVPVSTNNSFRWLFHKT